MEIRRWMPLIGVVLLVFVFNTSEFMPMAILTDIGTDLGLDEAGTGTIISLYAWVVALLSLPLMVLFSKVEYRKLLLGTVVVFMVFQVLSGMSGDYGMLMLSRIGVACAHAIFWSIAPMLAVHVAPDGYRSMALGSVVAGTSIAMVIGLPLGRMIGLALGWRMTFIVMGLLALVVLIMVASTFPRVPNSGSFTVRGLPGMLRKGPLLTIYLLTFMLVTGYYLCYSYIEPYLGQVVGMSASSITLALSAAGLAGILGGMVFSRWYPRGPYRFLPFTVIMVALPLLLFTPASASGWLTVCLLFLMVMGLTMYSASIQSELLKTVDMEEGPVAMSLQSGMFNVGIAMGAILGGNVCNGPGIQDIGLTGGLFALVSVAICMLVVRMAMRRDSEKGSDKGKC